MYLWLFLLNIYVYQCRILFGIILLWYEIVVNNQVFEVYLRIEYVFIVIFDVVGIFVIDIFVLVENGVEFIILWDFDICNYFYVKVEVVWYVFVFVFYKLKYRELKKN